MDQPDDALPPVRSAQQSDVNLNLAIFMLGGQRQAAKELDMSDRSIRYLAKGELAFTDRLRKEVADLVRRRGFACLELSRQLRAPLPPPAPPKKKRG